LSDGNLPAGGTPLVVGRHRLKSRSARRAIHLKDVVKQGMRELVRRDALMGIMTVY